MRRFLGYALVAVLAFGYGRSSAPKPKESDGKREMRQVLRLFGIKQGVFGR